MIEYGVMPRINLDDSVKGLFLFFGEGAIGKSYLADAMSAYSDSGLFYVKTFMNSKVVDFGDVDNSKVIMLDRLDMYINEDILQFIKKYSKTKTILADLKTLSGIKGLRVPWGFVDVSMGLNRLDVEVV